MKQPKKHTSIIPPPSKPEPPDWNTVASEAAWALRGELSILLLKDAESWPPEALERCKRLLNQARRAAEKARKN